MSLKIEEIWESIGLFHTFRSSRFQPNEKNRRFFNINCVQKYNTIFSDLKRRVQNCCFREKKKRTSNLVYTNSTFATSGISSFYFRCGEQFSKYLETNSPPGVRKNHLLIFWWKKFWILRHLQNNSFFSAFLIHLDSTAWKIIEDFYRQFTKTIRKLLIENVKEEIKSVVVGETWNQKSRWVHIPTNSELCGPIALHCRKRDSLSRWCSIRRKVFSTATLVEETKH